MFSPSHRCFPLRQEVALAPLQGHAGNMELFPPPESRGVRWARPTRLQKTAATPPSPTHAAAPLPPAPRIQAPKYPPYEARREAAEEQRGHEALIEFLKHQLQEAG